MINAPQKSMKGLKYSTKYALNVIVETVGYIDMKEPSGQIPGLSLSEIALKMSR
jgi:hypothetical protein